ncbi:hypothetical protein D3C86_1724290 [compost metagenome]
MIVLQQYQSLAEMTEQIVEAARCTAGQVLVELEEALAGLADLSLGQFDQAQQHVQAVGVSTEA